jgi:hypothetical protein
LNDLERLVALEDIRALRARYFRCVDTKDWAGLAAVFATDAIFERAGSRSLRDPATGEWHPPLQGESTCVGREAILEMIRRAVEPHRTVHHGHAHEIEFTDDRTARGICAMQDEIRDARGALILRGSGYYHDAYTKVATGWAIQGTRISRLWLESAVTG